MIGVARRDEILRLRRIRSGCQVDSTFGCPLARDGSAEPLSTIFSILRGPGNAVETRLNERQVWHREQPLRNVRHSTRSEPAPAVTIGPRTAVVF